MKGCESELQIKHLTSQLPAYTNQRMPLKNKTRLFILQRVSDILLLTVGLPLGPFKSLHLIFSQAI
jgi:hypothetical protein